MGAPDSGLNCTPVTSTFAEDRPRNWMSESEGLDSLASPLPPTLSYLVFAKTFLGGTSSLFERDSKSKDLLDEATTPLSSFSDAAFQEDRFLESAVTPELSEDARLGLGCPLKPPDGDAVGSEHLDSSL